MNTNPHQCTSPRRTEGVFAGLFRIWIRLLRWVHVTTGRELQRYAVWRLQRELTRSLREEAKRAGWN